MTGIPKAEDQYHPPGPDGLVAAIRNEAALIVAIAMAVVMYTIGKDWLTDDTNMVLFSALFVVIFGVMVWAAFAAVRHADSLAEILGEPYGTLILTISVICIEVSVISAVMLTGDSSPTLARDTMLAVLMIVLNAMVGISLLIGGKRYQQQNYNLEGARTFLSVLITLVTISMILPTFTVSTDDPSLTKNQAVLFSTATIILYGAFLAIRSPPAILHGAGVSGRRHDSRARQASGGSGDPLAGLSRDDADRDARHDRPAVEEVRHPRG